MKYWTTSEMRILRELYPALGARGVLEHLPGRTMASITSQASIHRIPFAGVRRGGRPHRWEMTAEIDAELHRFVLDNPLKVDLRKVEDQEWFIRLVAGDDADGRQHRRKRPGHQQEQAA